MPRDPTAKSIRERMLRERRVGLKNRTGNPHFLKASQTKVGIVSPWQLLVENVYGQPLEEILKQNKITAIAKQTGLNRVTIWRWKRLMGIE